MPLGIAQTADLSNWWQRAGPIVATGGNISTITDNGNTYTLHTFSTVGTDTFRVISGSGSVDMFVLAGGGPGGQATSGGSGYALGTGGGGAGYLAIGMSDSSVDNFGPRSVSVGTFSVVVGNGGNRAAGQYFGGNSSVFGLVAEGGGSGGITDYIPASPSGADYGWGIPGGCGGGASPTKSTTTPGVYNEGGIGTQGQDGGRALNFDTGEGPPAFYGGGGGGGIFDTGSAGFTGNPFRGEGGDGRNSSFNGVSTWYGGGGGGGVPYRSSGGVDYFGGDPGLGGGGTGGCYNAPSGAILPTAGANNTGGGGGGGYLSTVGANGGSGLVMIRYLAT